MFACDDTARSGFKVDGGLDPFTRLNGQSNSNLWFTDWAGLQNAGQPAGQGGPWLDDSVRAGEASTPYLFAGYEARTLHLSHACDTPLAVHVETGPDTARRAPADRQMFAALADIDDPGPWVSAAGRVQADEGLSLSLMARAVARNGSVGEPRYYEMGQDLRLAKVAGDTPEAAFLRDRATFGPPVFEVDAASVVLTEGGRRYRLPKAHSGYDVAPQAWPGGWPCGVREVVTERALLNAHGTFYVLPRPSSGGAALMKPVTTHGKKITDHFSWRGLLVLAGTRGGARPDGHYVRAEDGAAGVWLGDIDDLWRLGKPRGYGGPWLRTEVRPDVPSDPYLLAGYDRKRVELSHDGAGRVRIILEVDPVATSSWHTFKTFDVPAGQTTRYELPAGYGAHWLRARTDRACRATVQLTYD